MLMLEDSVRRERKRGHPSKAITFRCPKELAEAALEEGRDQTEGLVALLDRGVDSRSELGKDWAEVVILAHREGITEGEALGRLAKAALERKGSKR